jgi:transcriptional regulator with XRE-family HTH domain
MATTDQERVSGYLASNLLELRKRKNLSQDRLSALAQIPRSTITHMESGDGNPSLLNLCKLAAALNISIEELLSRPRSDSKLLRASDVPILKRSAGKVEVHKLMPDKVRGIEIDRVEIKANASMTGQPHLQGTKEYLMTLKGEVTVSVAGSQHAVRVGDVLAFPGDQKHGYRNTGSGTAVALSVVLPMPLPVAS